MNEYDFTESMMQAMADKLAPKLLAGMQERFDLAPIKDEIKSAERLSTIAIILSVLNTAAILGYFLGAAFAVF